MRDTPEHLARWPQLAAQLHVCADVIEPAFRKADAAALRHQWYPDVIVGESCATGSRDTHTNHRLDLA
jgi:hypothetical protein